MPATTPRLLHVAQPTTAGVARCVADLARSQARAGWDVHVACPPGGTLGAELAAAGVRVHAWPATRSPSVTTAWEVQRLRAVTRQVAPELVHLHSSKAGLVGRLLVRGSLPTVFQPHAWSFDAVTGAVRRATLGWERAAGRWTSLLVCVSEAERAVGDAAGVGARSSVVVPNGVDVEKLLPASAGDRAAARAQLGLDGPLAVCVGRLAHQKGQDLLLAAWREVVQQVPAARLALVGSGSQEQALRAVAAPEVRFAGQTHDVQSWLAAADVVVAPSRWEGMALAPLEAMARARSVIATDVTGIRESVPQAAGAVVGAGDVPALAAALVARLSGAVDADAEGRVGRAHVVAHHDLRRTVAATTAAYARALG